MTHLPPNHNTLGPMSRDSDNWPHRYQHGFGADSPRDFILSLGLLLHVFLVVAEMATGFGGNTAALLADGGRNLGSGLCLGLAWWRGRPGPEQGHYPYGFNRLPLQASAFMALGLCAMLGFLLLATVDHLRHPQPVNGLLVGLMGGAGMFLHAGTAWLLVCELPDWGHRRRRYWYLFTDALVSLGVAGGGALIYLTSWPWVDALIAVGLVGVIAYSCWSLLTPSRLLRASALDIDEEEVRAFLLGQPGVREVNALRIWALNPVDTALSVHLVRPRGDDHAFVEYLQEGLHKEFNIRQATVQLKHETSDLGASGPGY